MRRSLLSPMPSERLIISKTFYIRCLLRCVMWVQWTVLLCPKFSDSDTRTMLQLLPFAAH
jgi:hypothetical protein